MKIMDCPYCNQPGAEKSLFKTRCPNPACVAYDPELRGGLAAGGTAPPRDSGLRDAGLRDTGDSAPEPGVLGPPASSRKTVKVKTKGSGCGWSILLWILAWMAFRTAMRQGGIWWVATVILAVLAWKTGKSGAESSVRVTRREERRVTPDAVIEYEDDFDTSGDRRVELKYRNWKGEQKTFTGDRRSMRLRGRHITVRVEPEGQRIALAWDRIANQDAIGADLRP